MALGLNGPRMTMELSVALYGCGNNHISIT